MSRYDNEGTFVGKLVTWFFVALLALAAIKLAFWVVGAAFGIGSFLIFTIGPILLVGWVVMKVWRWLTRRNEYGEG